MCVCGYSIIIKIILHSSSSASKKKHFAVENVVIQSNLSYLYCVLSVNYVVGPRSFHTVSSHWTSE